MSNHRRRLVGARRRALRQASARWYVQCLG